MVYISVMILYMREVLKMIKLMEMEQFYGLMEPIILDNFKITTSMVKDPSHGGMEGSMKVNMTMI